MSTQSVRLADVAQRAGTSTKTASRVLNGDPRVADDTRRRVQDAMNELGYQVDVLARSLRTGVDETIAVVVPTIGDPFFASMIEEIQETLSPGLVACWKGLELGRGSPPNHPRMASRPLPFG